MIFVGSSSTDDCCVAWLLLEAQTLWKVPMLPRPSEPTWSSSRGQSVWLPSLIIWCSNNQSSNAVNDLKILIVIILCQRRWSNGRTLVVRRVEILINGSSINHLGSSLRSSQQYHKLIQAKTDRLPINIQHKWWLLFPRFVADDCPNKRTRSSFFRKHKAAFPKLVSKVLLDVSLWQLFGDYWEATHKRHIRKWSHFGQVNTVAKPMSLFLFWFSFRLALGALWWIPQGLQLLYCCAGWNKQESLEHENNLEPFVGWESTEMAVDLYRLS